LAADNCKLYGALQSRSVENEPKMLFSAAAGPSLVAGLSGNLDLNIFAVSGQIDGIYSRKFTFEEHLNIVPLLVKIGGDMS
jgi:hypothetical protein